MKPSTRIGFALLFLTQLGLGGFAQTGGVISTVAGNGTAGYGGDSGPAVSALINNPEGIAVDSAGNLYIADTDNQRIRKVTPAGVISTVAGNGTQGFSGDGGPATAAQLRDPVGVAVDSAGNLYVADFNNLRVRKVTPAGAISTVALITFPQAIAVDPAGNLYVSDSWTDAIRIHKVTPAGVVTTVAGGGNNGPGDGGPATSAYLDWAWGLAADSAGNFYIADDAHVRKVMADGTISTIAGNGTRGYSGDGGPATSAQISAIGVAVDSAGNLYIADNDNQRIRKVTPAGVINTVAGNGTRGFSGDGSSASSAQLNYPCGVAVGPTGSLYILDAGNNRIRKVEGLVAATAYFPQIAVGGGWSSLFTVTNTGATETSGELTLTDQQGNPFTVKGQLTDSFGTTQPAYSGSSFDLTLPSGGTVFLSASALGARDALKAGWAQLDSPPGSLTAVATFEYAGAAGTQCMVGILQSQPLQFATMPVDNDTSLGKQVVYAIANPSSQTIAVKLTLVGQDGTIVDDKVSVTLGPGQQIARYLWQDLARPNFKGSLVLRAQNGQTFVAAGLLEKQGLYAVIPLIPGKAPGVPD